jgi:predicted MPP superfamily phosphohydrolase
MLNASMFLLFFMIVWCGGHAWIAWSLLRPLHPGSWLRRGGWLLLGASLLLVPTLFFTRHWTGIALHYSDMLSWVAYIDMSVFLVLWPMLLVRDLGWMSHRVARWLRQQVSAQPAVVPDQARRKFLANGMNAGLLGLTGGMTVAGYREARRIPQIREVTIPVPGLAAGLHDFHIVQLSDIHLGPTIKGDYLLGIVERSNELQPDLVVITGDLVDGFTSQLQEDAQPLTQLRARHGSWFVTGNHEYYWGVDDWVHLLPTLGVQVLINEHQVIRHGNARLLLAGATDYSAGFYRPGHASDPVLARQGAGVVDYSILLAHQPRSVKAALAARYDLQLSGHIHGGQFFPWNFVIGLVQPFRTGLHFVDQRLWLYVSAGTGYWGPPTRLGVPSEITSIHLQRV